jgi:hypothetical protein
MADFTLNVGIDPTDLVHIRNMGNPAATLFPAMEEAMHESLDEVEYQAQSWMWSHFENPTGTLENAFEKHVFGPFSAWLINDLPYAQRANYGFNDMTDSLGRYYEFWPGIAWAENAVANSYPSVELTWQIAIDKAMGRI